MLFITFVLLHVFVQAKPTHNEFLEEMEFSEDSSEIFSLPLSFNDDDDDYLYETEVTEEIEMEISTFEIEELVKNPNWFLDAGNDEEMFGYE